MNYEQFLETLAGDVQKELEGKYLGIRTDIREVSKLQGESYRGLSVQRADSNISVNTDMNPCFQQVQNGLPYEQALRRVVSEIEGRLDVLPRINPKMLKDYEQVKDKLLIEVISTKNNQDMLQKIPSRRLEDMSEVYRLMLHENEAGSASVLFTNDMLQTYGITQEQLHQDALEAGPKQNPWQIDSLFSVLAGMMGDDLPGPDEPSLYVATNESKYFGAGVIAYPGFMEAAAEKLGRGFYILPSSIHEVLLLPDDGQFHANELLGMVTSINATEVAPEERLTDNVYHYDARERVFETGRNYEDRVRAKEQAKESRGSVMKDLAGKKEECRSRPTPPRREAARGGAVL